MSAAAAAAVAAAAAAAAAKAQGTFSQDVGDAAEVQSKRQPAIEPGRGTEVGVVLRNWKLMGYYVCRSLVLT